MKIYVFSMCLAAALAASGQVQAGKKLDSIFTIDMLNIQVAYLETITGPAKRVTPLGGLEKREYREYIVEGCKLYTDVKKGDVVGYRLPLTDKCQADLSQLLLDPKDPKSTKGLTIGRFQATHGDLAARASCLRSCGNAADPTADFIWEGSHADNFVRVSLGVTLASDTTLRAANKWRDVMEAKEGEDYVIDTKFNCTDKYSTIATDAFKSILIDAIAFDFQTNGDPYAADCKK